MPDFRGTLDKAKFDPQYDRINTTGPNAAGEQQTWQNPNQQLTQSSAQQLADLMGAKLEPLTYGGGPYSQDKPQYELKFSGSPDQYDAAMVADRYARAPEFFNASMAAELASSGRPSVAAQEAMDRGRGPVSPAPSPSVPPPGAGTPTTGLVPGPKWKMPELPSMPTAPGTTIIPGGGVANPGGFTPPPNGNPPSFPMPIHLNAARPDEEAQWKALLAANPGLLAMNKQYGGGLLR